MQMPKNVCELIEQTYNEYNLHNGNETYANSLVKVLKRHHLWPSMQVKKFRDSNLVLLHNTYLRNDVGRFKQLYEQCRSLVLDFSVSNCAGVNNVVVSYSNNIPERINIDDYAKSSSVATDRFQEAMDGTMITVYYFDDKWHFGTSTCTDAYFSKFANTNKSHGHLFNEVLMTFYHQHFTAEEINTNDPLIVSQISQKLRHMFTTSLDPSIAYEFVLVHHENLHIVDYSASMGQGYKLIYHANSKNRQSLEEIDISSKPLAHLGVQYSTYFSNLNDAYNHIQSSNSYGFIVKTSTPNGIKLFKISPSHIDFKENTDPCNPNVWHNILMVYMKNKKDYKINDYIRMYAPNIQLPSDDKGKPLDPTYLIHTMISTLKDVLYNLYIATTTYNSKSKKFKMNKELDQQFPPVIRFHLAQLRHRQQYEHSTGLIRPKDVYYYLCHCNNVKNIKLLITFLSTSIGYNISERGALCLTVLNGLL